MIISNSIRKLVNHMRTTSMKRVTLMVTGLVLGSAFLGFGRESFIAYAFGATGLTDAFYIALIVPDMIGGWISSALTDSMIPVLKEEISRSFASAQKLMASVFWVGMAILSLLTVIGYCLRDPIIYLLAPGLSVSGHEEAVRLLGVMLLSVVFSGLSGILWGIHNAHERFSYPALVGIVHNVLFLVVGLVFGGLFGIQALAYAYLVGTLGRLFVQFIPFLNQKYLMLPKGLIHPSMLKMVGLMFPILISTGVGTLNLIVDRMLASGLPSGYLSDLNFASKLGLLPVGIINSSLAVTLYTRFVNHSLDGENAKLRHAVVSGLSWTTFLGISIGTAFIFYSGSLIELMFHHGAFAADDVWVASGPLKVYGYFMVFYLISPLLTRFFFAKRENAFVARSSFYAVAVNIVLSIATVHYLGVIGLALSNALSQVIFVIQMVWVMCRRTRWRLLRLTCDVLRPSLAPGLAFSLGSVMPAILWPMTPSTSSAVILLHGMVALLGGVSVLGVYAWRRQENFVSEFICETVRQLIQRTRSFVSS
jgi:putative peptidoglycan lipid II flippase